MKYVYVRPLVYVAGPITIGDRISNVELGIMAGEHLWMDCEVTPFIPHLSHYWEDVASRADPDGDYSRERWLHYDFHILQRCDALYRIAGESVGADREVAEAKRLEIPVFTSSTSLQKWARQHYVVRHLR